MEGLTAESSGAKIGGAVRNSQGRRFYKPELDAMRFFAFLCVLVHHGAARPGAFVIVRRAGGFGLSLFFLLSAYLITQLLLQEREQRGTVHLKAFYVRRLLRIWPLYYAALLISILIGEIPPHTFAISHMAMVGFALFLVNWLPTMQFGLFGPMWSLSVEEQFYLIWPLITKLRGRTSVIVASTVFIVASAATIMIFSARTWMLWYNTFVEFLFFGTGALLAVVLRDRPFSLRPFWRLASFAAGLASWAVAAGIGGVGADRVPGLTLSHLYIGYGGACLGCVFIFLAFLGASRIPGAIVYLGKISYGLYVVHFGMSRLSVWLLKGMNSTSPVLPFWKIAVADSLTLVLCTGLAAFSYQYLEKPFLRLKEKFAFVRSRPAD